MLLTQRSEKDEKVKKGNVIYYIGFLTLSKPEEIRMEPIVSLYQVKHFLTYAIVKKK